MCCPAGVQHAHRTINHTPCTGVEGLVEWVSTGACTHTPTQHPTTTTHNHHTCLDFFRHRLRDLRWGSHRTQPRSRTPRGGCAVRGRGEGVQVDSGLGVGCARGCARTPATTATDATPTGWARVQHPPCAAACTREQPAVCPAAQRARVAPLRHPTRTRNHTNRVLAHGKNRGE